MDCLLVIEIFLNKVSGGSIALEYETFLCDLGIVDKNSIWIYEDFSGYLGSKFLSM